MLTGISERVADIKTRSQAMKCLTTFSEAVGPGFIFDRVSSYWIEYISYKIHVCCFHLVILEPLTSCFHDI